MSYLPLILTPSWIILAPLSFVFFFGFSFLMKWTREKVFKGLLFLVLYTLSLSLFWLIQFLSHGPSFTYFIRPSFLFSWVSWSLPTDLFSFSGGYLLEFSFDGLTFAMSLMVCSVSFVVHLYSFYYLQKEDFSSLLIFLSYLSLFTFFMLILVSSTHFIQFFLGWEGILNNWCPKWFYLSPNLNEEGCIFFLYLMSLPLTSDTEVAKTSAGFQNRFFFSGKTSLEKIGPHNIDILSLFVGSLLGDGHLEKRNSGIGCRLKFEQSSANVEYLMWFHTYISIRGYCSLEKPRLRKRIREKGVVYYFYIINSFTFYSLIWLHELFYKEIGGNLIKRIPDNIETYLTPLALAIWFMDDGSKLGKGAKIATNCFQKEDLVKLCIILQKKFHIKVTVQSGGTTKGFTLYIHVSSMPTFSKIVKPLMLPSLYYKLGDY